MQEVLSAFCKGWGNFVWGGKVELDSQTCEGQGNAVGILDGNLCKVGLSLASGMPQARQYSGRSR